MNILDEIKQRLIGRSREQAPLPGGNVMDIIKQRLLDRAAERENPTIVPSSVIPSVVPQAVPPPVPQTVPTNFSPPPEQAPPQEQPVPPQGSEVPPEMQITPEMLEAQKPELPPMFPPGAPVIPEEWKMTEKELMEEKLREQEKEDVKKILRTLFFTSYKFTDAATGGLFKKVFKELDTQDWPESATREIMGEIAHFGGFLAGPMKVGKLAGGQAASLLSRIIKNPRVLSWAGYGAESTLGLGTAMAVSDIADLKNTHKRFGTGAALGAIFGANALVHMEKHPVISQALRQVGSRALSSIINQYESPKRFSEWKNMDPADRAKMVFDEILMTYFSKKGIKAKDITESMWKKIMAERVVKEFEKSNLGKIQEGLAKEQMAPELSKGETKIEGLEGVELADVKQIYVGEKPVGIVRKGEEGKVLAELRKKFPEREDELYISAVEGKADIGSIDTFERIEGKLRETIGKEAADAGPDTFTKTLEEIERELSAGQPEGGLPAGMSVEYTKPLPGPGTKRKEVVFDPLQEQVYKEGKTLPKKNIVEKVVGAAKSFKNSLARTYIDLPNEARFVNAKDSLKRLESWVGTSGDLTFRNLKAILHDLTSWEYDQFSRKVILDDLMESVNRGEGLHSGFTPEQVKRHLGEMGEVIKDNPRIGEAIDRRRRVWETLRKNYTKSMEEIGFNVEDRFGREDYFRHIVLQYAELNRAAKAKAGGDLETHKGRSWLKGRKDVKEGDVRKILSEYAGAEWDVMSKMIYDIQTAKTIKKITTDYDITGKLKAQFKRENRERAKKGEPPLKSWRELIPEGYTDAWQPEKGNVFYWTMSVPEKLGESLMDKAMKEEIPVEEAWSHFRRSLTLGGKKKRFCIPEELAKTLDNFGKRTEPTEIGKVARKLTKGWKQWVLHSHRRFPKYTLRNLTGDTEAALVGNPDGFRFTPRAIKELFDVFAKGKEMSPEMKMWQDWGGFQMALNIQEIGEIKKADAFRRLYENKTTAGGLAKDVWLKYWQGTRMADSLRESVLRYANFLSYKDQMAKNPEGRPKNFGASNRDEIMAQNSIDARAFRLSNELLGPYNEIGQFGQMLRAGPIPFWSWKEVNTKRFFRMMKNAAQDGNLASAVGRKMLGTAFIKAPYMAYRVGRFWLKASALMTAIQMWNNLKYSDIENELSEEIRNRPHINLGRNKDGTPRYFTRIGAIGDFMEWFGLDTAPDTILQLLTGNKNVKEVIDEELNLKKRFTPAVNTIVQGVTPLIKLPAEVATKSALFPDFTSPRRIRNTKEYIANQMGLAPEYRLATSTPGRPYLETLPEIFLYSSDPNEMAYHDIFAKESKFLKEIGKETKGFVESQKGNALFEMKRALRWGDAKTAEHFMQKYLGYYFTEHKMTGRPLKELAKAAETGMERSFLNMAPLSRLDPYAKKKFVSTLNEKEKKMLEKAGKFYWEVLLGKGEEK